MLQGQYNGHWLLLQGIIEVENLSNQAEFMPIL